MSLGVTSNYLQNNFKEDKSNDLSVYEFEDFRLDAAHLMLYRNAEVVTLTPKVVETLVALVERRGEMVSKDELMDRLWSETAVEESNLSQNLYVLRKTLGNCADGKPLIETFRRRGYRFNGEIRQAGEIELLVATRTKTLTLTEEAKSSSTKSQRYLFPIGAGLLVLILLAFGAWRFFQSEPSKNQPQKAALAKMTRITPDQNIGDMTISPDGKYLAYVLNEREKSALWLKDLASGGAAPVLPPTATGYGDLVFAPDGKQIFYTVRVKNQPELTMFRIPTFGGEAREVARHVTSPGTPSPDGKQIAFVRMTDLERSLIIVETDSGDERVLSKREGKTSWYEAWGSTLSWSPDGQKIALCGAQAVGSRGRYELIEVSVSDGAERIIPLPDWSYADDVAWLSDQSGLLVMARETETSPFQVWRVSYPNGEVSRLTNDTNEYDDLSLSADSRLLVVRQNLGNVHLWTMPLDNPNQARQLTFGATASANDGSYGVAIMPDGKIIYTSPRDGNVDLWMTDTSGEQKQITKNAGAFNGRPRVAPDGKTIIFVSSRSGAKQLWRMDADGGNPLQLTDGKGADQPWISPDGAWIYFTFWRDDGHIIAKIPAHGGEIVSVYEKNGPNWAIVSPDGKQMLFDFYEDGAPQPWKKGLLSLETGEMNVIEENGFVYGWTADSSSLLAVRGKPANLWEVPLEGGKARQLTNFESGRMPSLAVSFDSGQIAFAYGNPTAEAVLISDF